MGREKLDTEGFLKDDMDVEMDDSGEELEKDDTEQEMDDTELGKDDKIVGLHGKGVRGLQFAWIWSCQEGEGGIGKKPECNYWHERSTLSHRHSPH